MEMTKENNIEQKLEDAGCPYFFEDDCGVKITDETFNKYCLDDYKSCSAYKFLENNKMKGGNLENV